MSRSLLDRIAFHTLNSIGILAIVVALAMVFNANLVDYSNCGAGCSDAGGYVSMGLVLVGSCAVLIAAFFVGHARIVAGKSGSWVSALGLVAIALVTLVAVGVVAFATR